MSGMVLNRYRGVCCMPWTSSDSIMISRTVNRPVLLVMRWVNIIRTVIVQYMRRLLSWNRILKKEWHWLTVTETLVPLRETAPQQCDIPKRALRNLRRRYILRILTRMWLISSRISMRRRKNLPFFR